MYSGRTGLLFIIANKQKLIESEGKARSLSLDLYDQWKTMEDKDGKWRFTSPAPTLFWLFPRLWTKCWRREEFLQEARDTMTTTVLLIQRMKEMGIRTYIDQEHQGRLSLPSCIRKIMLLHFRICTSILRTEANAIYPGKVTEADTFRIGNIGEIYEEDIEKVCSIMKEFLEEDNMGKIEAVIFDWAGTTVDFGCFAP